MTRLAISVEGQTEEEFVKKVLAEHLRPMEVDPMLLGALRRRGGGGNVSIDELVSDMASLRGEYDTVTSLVDFYGFRDKGYLTVEELERRLLREIEERGGGEAPVFPYVQKHEFEGLLFSDPAAFRALPRIKDGHVAKLEAVRRQFATPEDINDDPDGAPGKRIALAAPGYRKRRDSPEVAQEAGLEKIRAECPRFHAWLTRMEGLAWPARSTGAAARPFASSPRSTDRG